MRAVCLIPVFNNATSVGEVVKKCRAHGFPVVVVNDGSTDDSAEAARQAGAHVVSFRKNRGKGTALVEGFSYVLEEFPEAELLVTLDADGQHDPADIPRLLEAAQNGNTLVIGSRTEDLREMPFVRRMANKLVSRFISGFLGAPVVDTQSGFRVFPMRLIREKKFSQTRYGIETEMLFAAQSRGLAIREVPIKAAYPTKTAIALRKDLVNLFDIVTLTLVKGMPAFVRSMPKRRGALAAVIVAAVFAWQFSVSMRPLEQAIARGMPIFAKLSPGRTAQEKLAVFEWLRAVTPADAIIFAPRSEGHRIMAFADRRAIVSSKVYPSESAEVARRERDIARFFFATDSGEAETIIRNYHVSYVLVPRARDWFDLCREIFVCQWVAVRRDNAARSFHAGDLTPEGNQRTLVGKLMGKARIPFLKNVWDSPSYLVYRVVGSSEPAPCELSADERQKIVDALRGRAAAAGSLFERQCNVAISLWQDGVRFTGEGKGLTLGTGIRRALADYLGDPADAEAVEVTVADPRFPEFVHERFVAIGGTVRRERAEPQSDAALRLRLRSALDWIFGLQRSDATFRNFIDPSDPSAPDPEPRDLALDALGSWALAEGYGTFRDSRYHAAASGGIAEVERRMQRGEPTRTNALSFSLMTRLRLWEITGDIRELRKAQEHAAHLAALISDEYWVPERFRKEGDAVKAVSGEHSRIATHIAFWALSRYFAVTKNAVSDELPAFAERLRERFLTSRIVERDLNLAETARLANGFRAFARASGDARFLTAAEQVGAWLAAFQYLDRPPPLDGAFPEHPQTALIDTNSVGRIAEGLVFAGEDFRDAARRALAWLMQMQYAPESLYAVPPRERPLLIGGLRANPSSGTAPIGAAAHFVLSGLWYLERQ